MDFSKDYGELETIRKIEAEELSVEWEVFDFLSKIDEEDECLISSEFPFGDACWHLSMWPNWIDEKRKPVANWMGLHLGRSDGGVPKTFEVSVGILNDNREVVMEKKVEQEFSGYGGWFLKHFCSRYDLFRLKDRLSQENHQRIRCTIKMPGVLSNAHPSVQVLQTNGSQSSLNQDITNYAEGEDDDDDVDDGDDEDVTYEAGDKVSKSEKNTKQKNQEENTKKGGERALEDFRKLLTSGENSDVTVQVDGVEIKAHRAILSARCPVLAAMFLHETEEKASNKITVEDFKSDVFEDFLHYLYTGSVQSLTEQDAFGLYRVADKYLVDDLKQECLEQIQVTLSVQTFCDTVKLALMHGESDLLQRAIDFAARNLPLIICTVEWQSFLREHTTEANEILIKCICPRNQNQYDK